MGKLRRLIVNADDFGISRGVNDGIIEAAHIGGITSTSLLVNLPDSVDAIARVRQCPRISVGLHFNLTVGNALTGPSSLTQGRTSEFYSLSRLLAAASLGMIDAMDIERECLAQIDRMTQAGFPPTHLDSHRHVHTHPAIYPAVLRAVQARRIPHLRVPCEPLDVNAAAWGSTLKKGLLLLSSRRSQHLSVSTAIGRPSSTITGFVGVSLHGGAGFADQLFSLIGELPAGTTELMTHPGYADAALATRDHYTVERETELKVLCSAQFRDVLRDSHVSLANFGDQTAICLGVATGAGSYQSQNGSHELPA
ncbi:MAG TPA: ChbG/HpnK family deacetylase [Gemmatimonadaceae bacterium]|nr:ChbG/HpnK family deacetylase [Gemmatimonadaceae bacterium]